MAKKKKTITAGPIVKTIIYTAPEPRDGPRVRAVKSKMTTAAQKAMNDKTARGKLEMHLAANFSNKDLFVTLTYRDKSLPSTRKEAVKLLRQFFKNLRKYRNARSLLTKYIYVTEELHGEKRLHHHIVLNATGQDMELIRSLWPHGDVIHAGYIGGGSFAALAEYLTKEGVQKRPVGAQMWTASRNMEKPLIETSYVGNDETLTAPPGCHVLEREERVTEFGAYCYIKYYVPPTYWGKQAGGQPAQAGGVQPLLSCL